MKIQVPVIRKTDVLVIGGTAAACHLASALRRKNRSVFCVTPYTYFGEELCARLDFAPEKLERLNRFVGALGAGGSTKLVADGGKRMQRIFNFKYPNEYIQRFAEVLERKKGVADFYDHDLGPETVG